MGASAGVPAPEPSAPLARYLVATVASVLAILSQYFLPDIAPATAVVYGGAITGWLVVYGIPVAAFASLVGIGPLRRWRADLGRSFLPALGWYGVLSAVAFVVTIAIGVAYILFDPTALQRLNTENPVLAAARSDPWLWIALAFGIGAVEETIFRGWIFGYWVQRGSRSLFAHAVWTSALFAGLHLYYGTTYLDASALIYPQLFCLGLAFSLAVRSSRGNLVWVALLHGAVDAASFLTLVSTGAALAFHYGLIGAGLLVAAYLYLRSRPMAPTPTYRIGDPLAPWTGDPTIGVPPAGVPVLPPPPPPPPPGPAG